MGLLYGLGKPKLKGGPCVLGHTAVSGRAVIGTRSVYHQCLLVIVLQ